MNKSLGSVFRVDALHTKFVGVKEFQLFAALFKIYRTLSRRVLPWWLRAPRPCGFPLRTGTQWFGCISAAFSPGLLAALQHALLCPCYTRVVTPEATLSGFTSHCSSECQLSRGWWDGPSILWWAGDITIFFFFCNPHRELSHNGPDSGRFLARVILRGVKSRKTHEFSQKYEFL